MPAVTFGTLYYLRKQLYSNVYVRIALGFLHEAYRKGMWWFELIDMWHKLFLTSLLRFLPPDFQLPCAIAVSVSYTGTILLVSPYVRLSDDRLAMLFQSELMLLLMASYIMNNWSLTFIFVSITKHKNNA